MPPAPLSRADQPPGSATRRQYFQPTRQIHLDELKRVRELRPGVLKKGDAFAYSTFLGYLEIGPRVRPGGPAIDTVVKFNALSLADQSKLVHTAKKAGSIRHGTVPAINRTQERKGDQILKPPSRKENPQRRKPRPVPTDQIHIEELKRVGSLPAGHLPKNDRSYYSTFLAHLETGPSVEPGGPPIRTVDIYKTLSVSDQNTLVNAAVEAGLHSNVRPAINRILPRGDGQRLTGNCQPAPWRRVSRGAAQAG